MLTAPRSMKASPHAHRGCSGSRLAGRQGPRSPARARRRLHQHGAGFAAEGQLVRDNMDAISPSSGAFWLGYTDVRAYAPLPLCDFSGPPSFSTDGARPGMTLYLLIVPSSVHRCVCRGRARFRRQEHRRGQVGIALTRANSTAQGELRADRPGRVRNPRCRVAIGICCAARRRGKAQPLSHKHVSH